MTRVVTQFSLEVAASGSTRDLVEDCIRERPLAAGDWALDPEQDRRLREAARALLEAGA